jgi:hypothetical protein
MPWDHHLRHPQDTVLKWYRSRQIEPPTEGRIDRLVRSAIRTREAALYEGTMTKLLPSTRQAMMPSSMRLSPAWTRGSRRASA